MKLSILICTLPSRKELFKSLWDSLFSQITTEVELLSWDTESASIGAKRNALLGWAKGEYVAFVDDDDDVSENYISLLMEGINKGVDCCSLKGIYTVDGDIDGIFEHSLKYKEWKTTGNDNGVKYERYPNHLNCIKASIAKQFKFPEKNHGEDYDWSKKLHDSGLLKIEHYIEQPIYFYKYRTKK